MSPAQADCRFIEHVLYDTCERLAGASRYRLVRHEAPATRRAWTRITQRALACPPDLGVHAEPVDQIRRCLDAVLAEAASEEGILTVETMRLVAQRLPEGSEHLAQSLKGEGAMDPWAWRDPLPVIVLFAIAAVVAYILLHRKPAPWEGSDFRWLSDSTQIPDAQSEGARCLRLVMIDGQTPSLAIALRRIAAQGPLDDQVKAIAIVFAGQQPGQGITVIEPKRESTFDSEAMEDQSHIPGDYRKRVDRCLHPGVATADGRVLARAGVACKTTDWCLVFESDNPVSRFLRECAADFVSDIPEVQHRWRAKQGLHNPGWLRQKFQDRLPELESWRDDLVQQFAAVNGPDCPMTGPKEGDPFQEAWMRAREGQITGRSVVSAIHFRGLASPGGYAIVEAEVSARRA